MRVRNFRLYLFGQAVSVTGTWVQMVASAWLVLKLTGSGVALGLVTALSFLPILLFGPIGGLIADRFDKRRTLIITQSTFALLAALLAALVLSGLVQVWHVYLLSFLQGLVTTVDNPTRQSFVVEIVGDRDLTNAVSLNSAVMTGTRVVGPAVAAILIATVGIGWCFLVNAVSYAAMIRGLVVMRRHELIQRPKGGRTRGGTMRGLRYAWSTEELRVPLLLMSAVFTLSFNFSVLFPMLVKGSFQGDAGTLGTVFSMMGLGSVVGALLMAHRAQPEGWLLSASCVAFGFTSIAVGLSPDVRVALPFLLLAGFTSIVFMISCNTTMQLRSADHLRGRVMAIYSMVFLGTAAIGSPIAGWVAQHAGPRLALEAGGLVAIIMGAVASRSRSILAPPQAGGAAAPIPLRPSETESQRSVA